MHICRIDILDRWIQKTVRLCTYYFDRSFDKTHAPSATRELLEQRKNVRNLIQGWLDSRVEVKLSEHCEIRIWYEAAVLEVHTILAVQSKRHSSARFRRSLWNATLNVRRNRSLQCRERISSALSRSKQTLWHFRLLVFWSASVVWRFEVAGTSSFEVDDRT